MPAGCCGAETRVPLASAALPWARADVSRSSLLRRLRKRQPLGVASLPDRQLREIAARPITYLPGSNASFRGDMRVVNRIRPAPAAEALRGHTLTRVPEPMPREAAELLRGFYGPLNSELAQMLRDKRFLWLDV